MYRQHKNKITFVHTNIVMMRIEEIIKSKVQVPLEKKTVLNLFYTHQVVVEKFSELMKSFDLSMEQFNVLRILRGQKGKPANMFLIQERMLAKTSNTTRLVDKLLTKGYVNRAVCEINRRKIEITITESGLDILKQLDPMVEKHEYFFAENLTSIELGQLNQLLEKYRNFTI